MKKRTREPYRTTVSKDAQRRSVTDTADFRDSVEQGQRDRLTLQEKLGFIDEELEEHDQVTQLTRGYLHVSLFNGEPTVLGAFRLELVDVAFDTTFGVVDNGTIATPYAVHAQNQLDMANVLFHSLKREPQMFTVRSTTLGGAPLDMQIGTFEFSLLVLSTA